MLFDSTKRQTDNLKGADPEFVKGGGSMASASSRAGLSH